MTFQHPNQARGLQKPRGRASKNKHSGFSVDAGDCIEARDRAALKRLLRYCAKPPVAMDRLRKEGTALVYPCAQALSGATRTRF